MNKTAFKYLFTYAVKNDFKLRVSDFEFQEIIENAPRQANLDSENIKDKVLEVTSYYEKFDIHSISNKSNIITKINLLNTQEVYCFMILIECIDDYQNDDIVNEKIKNFPKAIYKNNDLKSGLKKARNLVKSICKIKKNEEIDSLNVETELSELHEIKKEILNRLEIFNTCTNEKLNEYEKKINLLVDKVEDEMKIIFEEDDVLLKRDTDIEKVTSYMNNFKAANIEILTCSFDNIMKKITNNVSKEVCNYISLSTEKNVNEDIEYFEKKANEISEELKILSEKNIEMINQMHLGTGCLKNSDLYINKIIHILKFANKLPESVRNTVFEATEQAVNRVNRKGEYSKEDFLTDKEISNFLRILKEDVYILKKESELRKNDKLEKTSFFNRLFSYKKDEDKRILDEK